MRSTITITTRKKKKGAGNEIRLFRMTTRQSEMFEKVAFTLAKSGNLPIEQAAVHVEKAIVKMLAGQMPAEHLPAVFHHMRLAFPILKPKDVERLPRHGCPRGTIKALILGVTVPETVTTEEGVTTANVLRTVLVELDDDQTAWHRDAMAEVMARDNCNKDDAWVWVNNLIGQLLAGAEMKEGADEMLIVRAVALFDGLSKDEVVKLPLATEDDLRRWSFTLDRARD